MLKNLKKNPDADTLFLESYSIELPFNRLKLGVDNVRYDVHISPEFLKNAQFIIFELIIKHANASEHFIVNNEFSWFKEIPEFKRLCTEILTNGVNSAKSKHEVQIDFLAQISLVKLLTEEIQNQYEKVIQHCKTIIRKQEISEQVETHMKLREEMGNIIHRKNQILQQVGSELFDFFIDAQKKVNDLRASNFGEKARLPEELFSNPILQITKQTDGFFLNDQYVLLGHRVEDPVNYYTLLDLFTSFLGRLREKQSSPTSASNPSGKLHNKSIHPANKNMGAAHDGKIDGWIKQTDNIDKLFNFFDSLEIYKTLIQNNADKQKILKIRQQIKNQKKRLNKFFRQISKEKMISGIVGAYKMQQAFENYCPPLSPQEYLQYLVVPKARKNTIRKLNRFKKYYGKKISLRPLKKNLKSVNNTPKNVQKALLIRFLKDFSRYHRDLINFNLVREAADCINLTTEDKIIKLSRGNNTLYEFFLSHENIVDQKSIINHVVIKADIRGSSAIIEHMKEQNLNPASSFSLNFFEPISKILSQYGAIKIFIEGDAIILAIFEHEGIPERWYSVARACGLSINILMIVKRYNRENKKNNLPRLDLGIGIGYANAPPTYFYDGDNQIMISPAINTADVLSECNKTLREAFDEKNLPFNIYVLQPTKTLETALLSGNAFLRYNVHGIELAAEGFKKLSREIHFTKVECKIPDVQEEPLTFYSGTYPTIAGNYQRLVIRESTVPEISPKDLSIVGLTEKKYYEVVTNQKIFDHVKKILKEMPEASPDLG